MQFRPLYQRKTTYVTAEMLMRRLIFQLITSFKKQRQKTPFVLFMREYEPLVNKYVALPQWSVLLWGRCRRFALLVHELQPRIKAFQITQFMCSAWMKPVCIHTMGNGHKTVNASPILADPSVWRSFSFKECIFHRFPMAFISTSHWIVGSNLKFISLYF